MADEGGDFTTPPVPPPGADLGGGAPAAAEPGDGRGDRDVRSRSRRGGRARTEHARREGVADGAWLLAAAEAHASGESIDVTRGQPRGQGVAKGRGPAA